MGEAAEAAATEKSSRPSRRRPSPLSARGGVRVLAAAAAAALAAAAASPCAAARLCLLRSTLSLLRSLLAFATSLASLPSLGTTAAWTLPGNLASNARRSASGSSVTRRGHRRSNTLTPATLATSSALAYRSRTRVCERTSATVSTATIVTAEVRTTAHRAGERFGRWCTVVRANEDSSSEPREATQSYVVVEEEVGGSGVEGAGGAA